MSSTYIHDYAHEYLSLFAKSGLKRQIGDAAVLEKIGAAPVSHVDVHASDTDYGHVMASSSVPEALGTAAVGTSLKYARADHVHPLPTNVDAETAKALKNPFMLYLEGAAVAEDRVDGVTDVHLRILKLDAQALEGLIHIDNLPVGTVAGTIAAGNHTHSGYAASNHGHAISDVSGLQNALDGKSSTGHTHDYSDVYAPLLHEHTHLDITDWDTELSSALSGYATVHDHPYLPLKGGAMESDCALCTDILENRGWYFGLVNNSNTYDFSSGGHVTINTKIGASDNSTGLGDYCIHVRGYLTSNSSKTIDLYIYLSNTPTSNNQKTVDLVTAYGYRNYGSVIPSDVKIYKRNTTSGDGIKIYFTIPTNDRGTFAMNVDFISHDLSKANITNINSTNASDNKLLHGWTIGNTIISSGTCEPCNSLSIHTHAELSAGDGLKYASAGQTYNGGEARELSVDVDDNFNWTGIHSFPATIKINKTGVLIGKGSSSAIDAKAGSADKQFLKYTENNGTGSYSFATITKNDIPNIEALNANAGAAGKLLVSKANGAEWLPTGANGNFLQQTANGLTFAPIRAHTVLQLTSSTTVQFTHTAGTDQTVFLNVAPSSTSTTTFNVKVPSPDSTYAGDRIKFVVLNEHDDTYTPIINFVPNDSNDAWQGDHAYDSDPLPTAQRRISCGEMMILYGVSYTANSTTHTFWRAQKLSETSF